LSPNYLTSLINSLIITPDDHLHFSFSPDFTRIVISGFRVQEKHYFESELVNSKWSYFKEILKNNTLTKSHGAPSYSSDNSTLFFYEEFGKPLVHFYSKSNEEWGDLQTINSLQDVLHQIYNVTTIGNNGLLLYGPIDADSKKKKGKANFYIKQSENY